MIPCESAASKLRLSLSLTAAVCAVLARTRPAAVRAHGGGVSVHVSRRRCHHPSVSGQERHQGKSQHHMRTLIRNQRATCYFT